MNIRKATSEDNRQLDSLLNLLLQEERTFDTGMNPEFKVQNFFLPLLEKENYHILVAEEERKLIGYLLGYELDTGGVYLEKVAYIDNMIVIPQHRNQGIGSALIQKFKTWCDERNITQIGLRTCVNNRIAVQFLKKNGFQDFKIEMIGKWSAEETKK